MYERFTDRARKVMVLANHEAQRFYHEYIGTEHVLLGLVKEGNGVAANVLKNLDLNLRNVRLEIEKIMQSGPERVIKGKLPQAPKAKKVIEYAMEEARKLKHKYVGTEHLLLGLLRVEEGVAAQVLMNYGLKVEQVREEVIALLGSGMRSMPAPELSPKEIEDLPDELKSASAEMDGEIQRYTLAKEEAIANQDFEKAAMLRDRAERVRQRKKAMIRDWIVNRPIDVAWLSWSGRAVPKLAERINDQRRWDALAELGTALEQAGCTDTEILSHCREAGEHSSHCWVVDLILANASRT